MSSSESVKFETILDFSYPCALTKTSTGFRSWGNEQSKRNKWEEIISVIAVKYVEYLHSIVVAERSYVWHQGALSSIMLHFLDN